MRIAIIGAGFSGLSLAWHLLQDSVHKVTLFDSKGIGGGASGIAPGLIHPYVGEQARRSLLATEGLQASEMLFQVAQSHVSEPVIISEGVIRFAQNEAQEENLSSHIHSFKDVVFSSPGKYLITSGKTINCTVYLKGLLKSVESLGGVFIKREISSLEDLLDFDQIVIAAGAGILKWKECHNLSLKYSKGQVLKCRLFKSDLKQSTIGKGYIALTDDPNICHVGSTYDKNDLSDTVHLESVKKELFTKVESFYPSIHELEVIEGKTAIRVLRQGHYAPVIGKLKPGLWILTGLGSRGLLYHALLSNFLKQAILTEDESKIPLAFRLNSNK